MGTNASITRLINTENRVNNYEQITVHWDGYLTGVGKTLLENYVTNEQVATLIAGGDISSLGARAIPDGIHPHNFEDRQHGVTTYYHRDRGDSWENCKPRTFTVKDDPNCPNFCHYDYLFKNGKWFYKSYNQNSFIPLTKEAIEKEE